MNCWSLSTVHWHLGWPHKVRERHQTLCPLRNIQLAWLDRESGMQQGMHRRMLSLCRTFRCHWASTAWGFFMFKADKCKHMKHIHCAALKLLPDSLEILRRLQVVEKVTWHLRSGFIEEVRGNHEGYYNIVPFKHETRRKNTERPDMSYRESILTLNE